MHIHILGICGTFMGSLALLARQAGYTVSGCDLNVYPPMSTHLEQQGIVIHEGYDIPHFDTPPDCYVIGNAIKRGTPILEHILNERLPYYSGPQWLGDHFLRHKHVLAVSGTHGKTTTASILTWILEVAEKSPSYLIGGIVQNFGASSAWNADSPYFVIEADEYDTAFFDKRSKFLHYHSQQLIINNIEFDHADIFPNLQAIETQFHHVIRTLPSNGHIIYAADCSTTQRVLEKGVWCATTPFGGHADWTRSEVRADNTFDIYYQASLQGTVQWALSGEHNASNALAAIIAASHIGISCATSIAALKEFSGIKRRMELRGTVNNISVYDDFAHHPTAIATTLAGAKKSLNGRIIAVFEPRSNTMKLGTMLAQLPQAFEAADQVFCYAPNTPQIQGDIPGALQPIAQKTTICSDIDALCSAIIRQAEPTDQIIVMSNGGFGGIHEKLLSALHSL